MGNKEALTGLTPHCDRGGGETGTTRYAFDERKGRKLAKGRKGVRGKKRSYVPSIWGFGLTARTTEGKMGFSLQGDPRQNVNDWDIGREEGGSASGEQRGLR